MEDAVRADPHPPPEDRDADTVVVRRDRLDALLDRVERLEAQVAGLTPPTAAGPPPPAAPPLPDAPIGRRRALAGLAGAAGAGAAAVLASGSPAAAADGNAIIIGSAANGGTLSTGLTVTGTGASYGLGVTDNGLTSYDGNAGVLGHAKGQNFSSGVHGLGEGASTGVLGSSTVNGTGVYGSSESGLGVLASSGNGTALRASNFSATAPSAQVENVSTAGTGLRLMALTHLLMNPVGAAPPTSTIAGLVGQLRWTDDGLWACVGAGTPGTWRRLAHASTAGSFHLLPVPIRVYDSRPGTTPSQGPKTALAGGVARTIDLKHNASGVPAGATGVLLTILLVGAATANGNLTVWANDKPKPQSNTMVWGGSATRFTTSAVSAVDTQARVKIDASHTTHVVLDVVGYYR
ncbi:MAG TPA: hypothetical protein VF228_23260 [Iamia sp.]